MKLATGSSLSTGKESTLGGKLAAVLSLGAQIPHHSSDSDDDGAHNRSVCFPVRWL